MKLKFLYPLIGCACGIFLAEENIISITIALSILGLSIAIWLLIEIKKKDIAKGFRANRLHFLWITFLFLSLGAVDYITFSKTYLAANIVNRSLYYTGTIEEIKYKTGGDQFKVKVKTIRDDRNQFIKSQNLHILVKTNGYLASKGDIIAFKGKAFDFSTIQNPSYQRYLRTNGIEYYSNVKNNQILKLGHSTSILTRLNDFKENVIIKIEKSRLNRETADFLISVLLGDRLFLREKTKETLSSAGLAHILALSGLHVAIVLSLILLMTFPLSLLGHSKLQKIITIVILWAYVILTGSALSTVRAAIMATLLLGSLILERKNSSLNSLLAAALIILLFDPLALWNVGFQLSFLCVLSIILFLPKLNPIDHHSHPISYKLFNGALVSIVVTFSTWVIVAYYFSSVPLLFLPANFFLLPFLPAFLTLGMIYIILLCVNIDFNILSSVLDYFMKFFIGAADFLSISGESSLPINISPITLLIWFLIIGLIYVTISSKRILLKKITGFASLTLLAIFFTTISIPNEKETGKLRFNHSFTKLEAKYDKDDKSTLLTFPRNGISLSENKYFHILSIDSPVKIAEIKLNINSDDSKRRYLFVGPSAQEAQIAELINNFNFDKVIFHAGIGKVKKKSILNLLEETQWDKIHSLRENGSVEFEL